ncbi:MAG: adenylyltransferase/cytidyltransferase family protein, partial [Deltaproteobacteria bacterium]
LHFLEQARELGDELVVVVARDSTVKTLKHHPVTNERVRRMMVQALEICDYAVLGYEGDHYRIIQELRPDIVALGYDQSPSESELKRELRARDIHADVVRLSRKTGDLHGTSEIIERIKRREDH